MIADVKKSAEQKMKRTLETLKSDLAKVRTGRAHTGLLDHIMVDYYGTATPLPQVANVTLIDSRTIGVAPWDKKMAGAVEKAIRDCGLGLNPAAQGELVRVPMPALTEERRKELAKLAHQYAEKAKVAIRNVRRDAMESLKEDEKKKEISEDEHKRLDTEVQKLTDRFVGEVDAATEHKEKEILTT